jgi:intracellular sulfur oxidation DsrE/DsrF family protein
VLTCLAARLLTLTSIEATLGRERITSPSKRISRYRKVPIRSTVKIRMKLSMAVIGSVAVALVVATVVAGPSPSVWLKFASNAAASPQESKQSHESHRVVILIDTDDEKVMGHAISYSMNIARSYAAKNQKVAIEVIANGLGIRLFRADTSPLQQPLAFLRQSLPDIVLSMCDSSRQIAEQREGHSIALIPGARLVPFGIGRVVELEEAGWSYIHG